ncbi:MAG TPA: M67 family metallopeptidase [Vicinamibacterales bacterium]|nr:M67 family metallopeptidase [Vicinamibacterales bacterium]
MTAGPAPVVRVPRDVRDAIVAHARASLPDECCGLCIGTRDRIVEAVPAANVRRSPTRYQIDPRDHVDALRRARVRHLRVCGAYHSHPGAPAQPSATDAAEMNDPSLLYVIVSLRDRPDVQAFRWKDGAFAPVRLVIEDIAGPTAAFRLDADPAGDG